MQTELPDKGNETAAGNLKLRYALLVIKFVVNWVFFLVILVATAFVMNIDWARSEVQSTLASTLGRNIKLGELSWNFGFNGVSFETASLEIKDPDGSPFINSGMSEIGVAFWPLTKGKLVITHLAFEKPEIWAKYRGDKNWNFSDLIKEGPEVKFLQVENGHVHVDGVADMAEQNFVFENVDLKLVVPRKQKKWPFFLALDLPRTGRNARVEIQAFGHGPFTDLRDQEFDFEVKTRNLSPADTRITARLLPQLKGLFDLSLKGSGAFKTGINAQGTASIAGLSVSNEGRTIIESKKASSSANISLDPHRLSWQQLVLKMDDLEIQSTGALKNWLAENKVFDADVKSTVYDLKKIPPFELAQAGADRSPPFKYAWQPMPGQAELALKISGDSRAPLIDTSVKARGLSLAELLKQGPLKKIPALGLFSDSSSKVKGQVKISSGNRWELNDAEISHGDSLVHLSGFHEAENSQLDLNASNLDLEPMVSKLVRSREIADSLSRHIPFTIPGTLSADGRVSVQGHIHLEGKKQNIKLEVDLKNAVFKNKGSNMQTIAKSGHISYDGKRMSFENVEGSMGNGSFTLTGSLVLSQDPAVNLNFEASQIDLYNVSELVKALNIQLPALSENQLRGTVKAVKLNLTGTASNPEIILSTRADNLYYQPPELDRPLHITDGSIEYKQDRLTLTKARLVSGTSTVTANVTIDDLSTSPVVQSVRAYTEGVELSDVHYYMSSLSSRLSSGYGSMLQSFEIAGLTGRIVGGFFWQRQDKGYDLSGRLNLTNVCIERGCPYTKSFKGLSGIIAARHGRIVLEDFSGALGESILTIDGSLGNYLTDNPDWKGKLYGSVYPDQLPVMLSWFSETLEREIAAEGPINIEARLNGSKKATDMDLVLTAEKGTNFNWDSSLIRLHQPADSDLKLVADTELVPGKSGKIEVKSSSLFIGRTSLKAKGTYSWHSGNKLPQADLSVTIPPGSSADLVLNSFFADAELGELKGNIDGHLTASGPLDNLTTGGVISLQKLSMPKFRLYDISGNLETTQWLWPTHERHIRKKQTPRASLKLDKLRFGKLKTTALNATVALSPHGKKGVRLSFENVAAKTANGNLEGAGQFTIPATRFQVRARFNGVDADHLFASVFDSSGEVSGSANVNVRLEGSGATKKAILSSLSGSGDFEVVNGQVTRFGDLEHKLTQANFLQQGIFGFNLNNLLQSAIPVRTGDFNELTGNFKITDGILVLQEMQFKGEDLRLRAVGKINMPVDSIEMEVAGNIPRITSASMLGPVGEVSKVMTPQRIINLLTFNRLERLPTLPVIGDLATDNPRAFTFHVAAELSDPDSITKSIENSFDWLPNRPHATAHPVLLLSKT